ncbi:hypothetical protein B7435_30240 [Mycolicibacterium peregrinum]|nr:hypothetical protein B7435_30240 [Mycolicibacterium peregrinum]
MPPRPYADEPWSWFAVRCALERAHFVYGVDDYALLSIGFPAGGGRSMEARLEVECRSFDGAGWCVEEIDGTVESVQANGSLEFTPDGMHDSVTVPAAYVVGLAGSPAHRPCALPGPAGRYVSGLVETEWPSRAAFLARPLHG